VRMGLLAQPACAHHDRCNDVSNTRPLRQHQTKPINEIPRAITCITSGVVSGACGQWLLPRRTRSSTQNRAGRPTYRRRKSRFHTRLFPTSRTVRSDPAAPFSDNATYHSLTANTANPRLGRYPSKWTEMPLRRVLLRTEWRRSL
jgi:hypothetical protein